MRTVSPSQMRVWENCPTAWDLSYNQKLTKPRIIPRHFDFGLYAHELQHVYYQTMKVTGHPAGHPFLIKMMEARIKNDMDDPKLLPLLADVWTRVSQFLKFHSPEIDANIRVMEAEFEFHVPVTTPKGHEVELHGIVDLVYMVSPNKIVIRDHKTGQKPTHSANSIKLDDQLLFYAVALSKYYEIEIKNVEINFMNSYIHKTKTPAKDEIFKRYNYTHTSAGLQLAEANLLRKIDLMLDTEPYRNYSPTCQNCAFFDICHVESRGLDTQSVISANYSKGTNDKHRTGLIEKTSSQHSTGDQKIEIRFTPV